MWRTRAGLLSQGRERPELVVKSGNFICWNLLWPGLGVHFAFFLPFFFFLVGEPPVREPPLCTSQSEEENFLVGLAPHPSLAGDASRDPVSLCRDKERVSAGTPGSEVSQPDTASARTTGKDSSGMLDLRQTSHGKGLDLAVWRQPGGPGPGEAMELTVSMHGGGEGLVAADTGTTGMHSGCGRSLRQTGPGQEKAVVHFPVGSLRLHSPHTVAWCWIWGGHILGKVCHRGIPGPHWQHGASVPEPPAPSHHSLALGLGWRQQRKGDDLGLLLCMGSLWLCRPDLLQWSLPLGVGIYSRAMELDWTWGFYCNNWGADPASQQAGDSHGAVRGPCPYI